VSQKRKVTLYFNAAMLAETQREALRQDRSISWIIQASWRIARDAIKQMPGSVQAHPAPDEAPHPAIAPSVNSPEAPRGLSGN
jgi:uncharacterized small protein (TIGR04563 family)